MPKCTNKKHSFGRIGRREIEANFAGGAISTDGGAMLLSRIDHFVGVSRAVAGALVERRDSSRITHCLEDMVRQRLFALAQGHEDLNDHDNLRSDPLFQTVIGTMEELASSPTLCRLER